MGDLPRTVSQITGSIGTQLLEPVGYVSLKHKSMTNAKNMSKRASTWGRIGNTARGPRQGDEMLPAGIRCAVDCEQFSMWTCEARIGFCQERRRV